MAYRDGDGRVNPRGLIQLPEHGLQQAIKKLRLKITELTARVEKLEKAADERADDE